MLKETICCRKCSDLSCNSIFRNFKVAARLSGSPPVCSRGKFEVKSNTSLRSDGLPANSLRNVWSGNILPAWGEAKWRGAKYFSASADNLYFGWEEADSDPSDGLWRVLRSSWLNCDDNCGFSVTVYRPVERITQSVAVYFILMRTWST